jgi:hypothetical protein
MKFWRPTDWNPVVGFEVLKRKEKNDSVEHNHMTTFKSEIFKVDVIRVVTDKISDILNRNPYIRTLLRSHR